MNKTRVEAFTDAVIAIILTIMILKIKTPHSIKLVAIVHEFPYIISYAVSFLFIGIAWYNHHYMFSKAHLITKRIFWANLFWIFATSFIPLATAWVGEDLNAKGPEIFYALIYLLWSISYILLSKEIIVSEGQLNHQASANSIQQMPIYKTFTNWKLQILILALTILTLIYFPAGQMILVTLTVLFIGGRFNEDSDHLFKE